MPNSKPAVAYLSWGCEMQKKFTKTAKIIVISCKGEKKYKSTRCKVGGITCSCPMDVIEVELEGRITFPEGAEKVALEEFGLSSLHTINQP